MSVYEQLFVESKPEAGKQMHGHLSNGGSWHTTPVVIVGSSHTCPVCPGGQNMYSLVRTESGSYYKVFFKSNPVVANVYAKTQDYNGREHIERIGHFGAKEEAIGWAYNTLFSTKYNDPDGDCVCTKAEIVLSSCTILITKNQE